MISVHLAIAMLGCDDVGCWSQPTSTHHFFSFCCLVFFGFLFCWRTMAHLWYAGRELWIHPRHMKQWNNDWQNKFPHHSTFEFGSCWLGRFQRISMRLGLGLQEAEWLRCLLRGNQFKFWKNTLQNEIWNGFWKVVGLVWNQMQNTLWPPVLISNDTFYYWY